MSSVACPPTDPLEILARRITRSKELRVDTIKKPHRNTTYKCERCGSEEVYSNRHNPPNWQIINGVLNCAGCVDELTGWKKPSQKRAPKRLCALLEMIGTDWTKIHREDVRERAGLNNVGQASQLIRYAASTGRIERKDSLKNDQISVRITDVGLELLSLAARKGVK